MFDTLRSSFGRSLALIVFPKCVFIRFRAHVESSLMGFHNIFKLFVQ